jgi:hypothetical protein
MTILKQKSALLQANTKPIHRNNKLKLITTPSIVVKKMVNNINMTQGYLS